MIPRWFRKTGNNQRGLTLVELIIGILILALMITIVVVGLSNTDRAKMRSAVSKLSILVKYLFDQSVVRNVNIRLVIDISENRYYVEYTEDEAYIPQEKYESDKGRGLTEEELEERKNKGGYKLTDQEERKTTFTRVDAKDEVSRLTKLPKDIKFEGIMTSHQAEIYSSGRAYIYFLRSGFVEKSIIRITNADESMVYSIEVEPMSGRSKIYPYRLEVSNEFFFIEEDRT